LELAYRRIKHIRAKGKVVTLVGVFSHALKEN
jgi:hypothetical protein